MGQRELAVKSLDVYDKIIASREYIAGERFTYADIQMVTSLQFLVRLNRLDITYRMAWYSGLKTTYYLRSIAATSTEKSTVAQGKLNAVSAQATQAAPQELGAPAPVPTACSLDDPDCEACQ